MRTLFRIAAFIFSLYGFLIFLIGMVLLMPFFLIAFLQKPLAGGNSILRLSGIWADFFFFMTGIHCKVISESPPDINSQYIFVSNHISYLDIPMMVKVIRKQRYRILGKAEMTRIPVFGSIYRRGTVSVDRESAAARKASVQRLIRFIGKGISVFICPEGTFNTTGQPLKSFYDGAFRIAIETQQPIKPVIFPDTYDRLNYKSIFSLNPGRCRAVWLEETPTAGMTLEDLPVLKETIYRQMENALIRYDAGWIKKGDLSDSATSIYPPPSS